MKLLFGIITLLAGIALGVFCIFCIFEESFWYGLIGLAVAIVLAITGIKVLQN